MRKIEKMQNFGALTAHSRMFLNFTWQILRENTPQNIKDKKHGIFWFLRGFKTKITRILKICAQILLTNF
nr:hypothetical protein [uncultured Campylobacter sp.]